MSSVSRSVYQKLKEENKRLIADIFVLVQPFDLHKNIDKILITSKWRKKFEEEEALNKVLKEACLEYLKRHPEFSIVKKIK